MQSAAVRTDIGTVSASIAIGAEFIHTIGAAVCIQAANSFTVTAMFAVCTDHHTHTIAAIVATSLTDVGTFRASVTGGAYFIQT
jgi:hypothetical protein